MMYDSPLSRKEEEAELHYEVLLAAHENGTMEDFFTHEYHQIFRDLHDSTCEKPLMELLTATDRMIEAYMVYQHEKAVIDIEEYI